MSQGKPRKAKEAKKASRWVGSDDGLPSYRIAGRVNRAATGLRLCYRCQGHYCCCVGAVETDVEVVVEVLALEYVRRTPVGKHGVNPACVRSWSGLASSVVLLVLVVWNSINGQDQR
jgi:hypothetical protein